MTTPKLSSNTHVKELAKAIKKNVDSLSAEYFNDKHQAPEYRGKLNEYQAIASQLFGFRHLHELNKNLSMDDDAKSNWDDYDKVEMKYIHSNLTSELSLYLNDKIPNKMYLQCLSFALASRSLRGVGAYVRSQRMSIGIKKVAKNANLSINECKEILVSKKLMKQNKPTLKAVQQGFVTASLMEDKFSCDQQLILWFRWFDEKMDVSITSEKAIISRIGDAKSSSSIVNSLTISSNMMLEEIKILRDADENSDEDTSLLKEKTSLIQACFSVPFAIRDFELFGSTKSNHYDWNKIFTPFFILGKEDKKAKTRNLCLSIEKQIERLTKNNANRTFKGPFG